MKLLNIKQLNFLYFVINIKERLNYLLFLIEICNEKVAYNFRFSLIFCIKYRNLPLPYLLNNLLL